MRAVQRANLRKFGREESVVAWMTRGYAQVSILLPSAPQPI